jgi:hypothetical protein
MSPAEFVGRIVHKHLVAELLKGGQNKERFDAKLARFNAAQDTDTSGGVPLMDQDTEAEKVQYAAIKPVIIETPITSPNALGPYPPLPSTRKGTEHEGSVVSSSCVLSTDLAELSLEEHFEAVASGRVMSPRKAAMSPATGAMSPTSPLMSPTSGVLSPTSNGASLNNHFKAVAKSGTVPPSVSSSKATETGRSKAAPKVESSSESDLNAVAAWTRNTSKTLFPNAQPTPPPSEWSLKQQDKAMEKQEGLNILQVRFWDPHSKDWEPERWFDPMINKYQCPFVCA